MGRCPVLAWAVLIGGPTATFAQPNTDDSTKLLAQWRHRQEAVPVVRYTLSWQPGSWPPVPSHHSGKALVLFDFGNRRLRADLNETLHLSNRREALSRWRQSYRFDGRELTYFSKRDNDAAASPAEPTPESVHVAPWGALDKWPAELTPLLWAHGVFWTEPDETGSRPPFGWQAKPDRFAPAGREVMDGRPCILFRDTAAPAGNPETIGIDPDRDGAVVLHRRVWSEQFTKETRIAYRATPHGWLPAKWSVTQLQPGRPPVIERIWTVEAVAFAAATAAEFRYEAPPGVRVRTLTDVSLARGDGSKEPIPPDVNDQSLTFGQKVWRTMSRLGWVFAVGSVFLVALIGVWVCVRRQKRGRPAP